MSLIKLDIDDSYNFYCPVTGEQILGPESFTPSSATVFTFSPEAGDFDSIEEPYKAVWEEIVEQCEDDYCSIDLWDVFCARIYEDYPSVIIFGFTSYGMACGPVSHTIYVAIDLTLGQQE